MRTEKNVAKQYQNHQVKHSYILNIDIFSFIANDITIIKIKIAFYLLCWKDKCLQSHNVNTSKVLPVSS